MTGARLHLNENGASCSPAVLDAIRSLSAADVSQYPEPDQATSRVARHFGVDPGSVLLTNGLDEGIQIVALAAAATDETVDARATPDAVIAEPAFEVYAQCARSARLRVTTVAPQPSLAFPLDDTLRAVTASTQWIVITDPNNPTGLAAPEEAITRLAAAAPRALVFVDEAYAEFSGRSAMNTAISQVKNVVVGRTFAKAYGLAGLRIGALVASPPVIDRLRPLALPYRLNVVALRAVVAALEDTSHLERSVAEARESREMFYAWARAAGIEYWPSDGNFVLLRIGADAGAVAAALARAGVLVRDKSNTPGCSGCIRITAGSPRDTRAALTALEAILAARTR